MSVTQADIYQSPTSSSARDVMRFEFLVPKVLEKWFYKEYTTDSIQENTRGTTDKLWHISFPAKSTENISIQSMAARYYSHPVIPPLDEIEDEGEADRSTDIYQ